MAEIQASTVLRTIVFDGTTITVKGRSGRVLRQVPLASVVAVQFKPAGKISSGSIQLNVSTRSDFRDHTSFAAKEQPAFEELHQALQTALAARPAPQTVLAGNPAPVAPALPELRPSATARWIDRLLLFEIGLQIIPLLFATVIILAVCGICGWVLITS